jgi:uncharacterized membrane protein YkvI
MKIHKVSALKIAGTYIGTVVGAGFATGQEILQFFNAFGVGGFWGIVLTTVLFIVLGYVIIELGFKLGAKSHLEILKETNGKLISRILDIMITFFLFGGLTAMIAGTGALFSQQLGLPSMMGGLIMAAITAVTVLSGLKGVINSISFVVPFLLVAVFGICIYSLINAPPDMMAGATLPRNGLINNWFLAMVLYSSYNIILSISVLGPLGAHVKNRHSILMGAILGGLGLGLGSLLIYLAISGHIDAVRDLEVPMVFIAENISYPVLVIFTVILIAEIYTTAVGSLYGFTARFANIKKTPRAVIGTTILAFLASLFGFSNLVKYLYPLVGYAGVLLLIGLVRLLLFRGDRRAL